jgi:hypothetical protein
MHFCKIPILEEKQENHLSFMYSRDYTGLTITQIKFARQLLVYNPLQNPTLRVLVAEGGNVLGRQTTLSSTEAKVRGIVPKAAWH